MPILLMTTLHKIVGVVDPSEASPVIAFLEKTKFKIKLYIKHTSSL